MLPAKNSFLCEFYRLFIRAAGQFINWNLGKQMIQRFQTKFHAVLQPAGIEDAVGNSGYFLKALQFSDGVFRRLFEDNQSFYRNICVLAVRGRAVPRGSPAEERFFCFLYKYNVAIDDQGVSVPIPEFRLGGLSDTRRAEEHQAVSPVVDEGTVELDCMTLDGMSVENLKYKRFLIQLIFYF